MRSSGGVVSEFYYVYGSYGYFCSPGTDWGDIACYLGPNGNIFEDINFYVDSVKDSYGSKFLSPDIRYTSFWWVDISGAPDSYLHNDVSYSYGNYFCSPRTNGSGSVWLINTSGDAWLFGTSGSLYIDGSYGLYSPDTSDIQFVWMVFPSGFINHNLDYTISYSYGSALRARKIPMALGMSALLATSSSTTTTVPTVNTLSGHEC